MAYCSRCKKEIEKAGYCKECIRMYQNSRYDPKKSHEKYMRNIDRVKKYTAKYREANKERIKMYQKAYREDNKELMKEYQKMYRSL